MQKLIDFLISLIYTFISWMSVGHCTPEEKASQVTTGIHGTTLKIGLFWSHLLSVNIQQLKNRIVLLCFCVREEQRTTTSTRLGCSGRFTMHMRLYEQRELTLFKSQRPPIFMEAPLTRLTLVRYWNLASQRFVKPPKNGARAKK